MDADEALERQAPLKRGDRFVDEVRPLGTDGVAKIGARLKVTDIRNGNEHLLAPAICRQAQRLARSLDDAADAQGSLNLVECLRQARVLNGLDHVVDGIEVISIGSVLGKRRHKDHQRRSF